MLVNLFKIKVKEVYADCYINRNCKTLHNICYRQLVIVLFLSFMYSKESYSVMYPTYNVNLINKMEIDNFFKQVEVGIVNSCKECILEYNVDKKEINDYDSAYKYGSKLNNNKIIFFEINRFNKKIKISYFILDIDTEERFQNIISIDNIVKINSIVPMIVKDLLIDNHHIVNNNDSLKIKILPQFGLFWGKFYNYRDSYNYDQWNLYPNEFTSIGVSRLFNRKNNQFKQLDLNILSSKQNVSDIGINILFNEKLYNHNNFSVFHGLGFGFHISTWEHLDEDDYFTKNNFSINYQSGILLFDKNKYSLMLRLNYQCLINDDFNDVIGANIIFLSTNTETYEKIAFNEIEFEFFQELLRLFFKTLFDSRENN